jgi:hypothetical protein
VQGWIGPATYGVLGLVAVGLVVLVVRRHRTRASSERGQGRSAATVPPVVADRPGGLPRRSGLSEASALVEIETIEVRVSTEQRWADEASRVHVEPGSDPPAELAEAAGPLALEFLEVARLLAGEMNVQGVLQRIVEATVRAVPGADLDLVGLALHGPRNAVDKVLKGCSLHP